MLLCCQIILFDHQVFQFRLPRVPDAVLHVGWAIETSHGAGDPGLAVQEQLGGSFQNEIELVLDVDVRRVLRGTGTDHAQLDGFPPSEIRVREPELVPRVGGFHLGGIERPDAVLNDVTDAIRKSVVLGLNGNPAKECDSSQKQDSMISHETSMTNSRKDRHSVKWNVKGVPANQIHHRGSRSDNSPNLGSRTG